MKKLVQTSICVALALICLFGLTACKDKTVNEKDLWENALYLEDTEIGEGIKQIIVEVKAGEKSVFFTINTDKETLGAALSEHNLIEGNDGLYTKVNGIEAVFETDNAYWGFFIDGTYADEGMDTAKIEHGKVYRLEYTKN